MKTSPFPGMDPWLEWHWGDVHTRLTTYASDQMQPLLPSGLRARVEEYVSVQSFDDFETGETRHHFAPDVRVIEQPTASSVGSGGVAVSDEVASQPITVSRLTDPETLHAIQIVDTKTGNRIITSIEFLSPANKSTEAGHRQYRAKQKQMLDGEVNLVEIDLLRSGSWVPMQCVPKSHQEPYRISVVRSTNSDVAEIYRVSLRAPLPTIKIPLRADDDDISLNLQSLIEAVYTNGGYEDLDYKQDPNPPLDDSDAEWADSLLREQSLR